MAGDEALQVGRRIPLAGDDGKEAAARITALAGVTGADTAGSALALRYDVTRCDIDRVLAFLIASGFSPADGRFDRLRYSWYRYLDTNARSNARHNAACCNKPPPGSGRRQM